MHETPQPPSTDPLVGHVLAGRFEIQALIDRGGMGKIYRAVQQPLGRSVALKVLDIHDGGGEFRQRFFLEASLCSRLSHPNTVRVFDYGCSDDGIYFIAMELLDGRTLRQLIAEEVPLDPERAVQILRGVCGALAEAHERGIVHRDLKPANIILTQADGVDFPKVVDFGLVKDLGVESELSKSGHVLGSPMYMSPEQVHNDEVDHRADIYAAGLILYALLTGRTPFPKGNPLSLLMAQINKVPPPISEMHSEASVPRSLEWVVFRAIEKERSERFASMYEMNRALKAVLKEIRGEVDPLELTLEDGIVVFPDGTEVSEDRRLPHPPTGPAVSREVPEDDTLYGEPTRVLGQEVPPQLAARFFSVLSLVLAAMLLMSAAAWTVLPQMLMEDEAPPVLAPAAAPARVDVLVRSVPPGAEVVREGVFLGKTPLNVQIGTDEEWIVDLALPEHEGRKVRMAADQPELTVQLTPLAAPEPEAPSAAVPSALPAAKKPPRTAPALELTPRAPRPVPADPTPPPREPEPFLER